MHGQISRLVGLEGFGVTRVIEKGEGACPHCGRGSIEVKERPRVRIRDLPICGRRTHPIWRKRRYRCVGCERTFTEADPALPVSTARLMAFPTSPPGAGERRRCPRRGHP
jgi:transposase